jgi:hypothetical protein
LKENRSCGHPTTFFVIKNEHDFANVIWQQTKDQFRDDYELTVSAEELGKLDSRSVKQAALEIASLLAGNPSLPIRSRTSVPWHFRRAKSYDDSGTRKGVVVIRQDPMTTLEDFNQDDAIVGTTVAMERELEKAATKFVRYEFARKVVLLDFCGDDLCDEDVPHLLARITLPQSVDEIWMTKQVWISEDSFDTGFERLFVREKGPEPFGGCLDAQN